MKILVVTEAHSWVDYQIAGSLEDLGHEVHRFFYGEAVGEFYGRARAAEREVKNFELLNLARTMIYSGGLDFIFCYVYDDFLLPKYAHAMADLDVPMVNLNVDMVNQWYRQIRTAKYFSRILCAQRANMDNLRRHGGKVMYFPMAGRLKSEGIKSSDFKPAAPVTFLGTPMSYRTKLLSRVEQAGIPLAVYGKFWDEGLEANPEFSFEKTLSDLRHYGWARLRGEGVSGLIKPVARRISAQFARSDTRLAAKTIHGFLPERDLNSLFRNSRINLGFTRMVGADPDRPGVNQVKLRDFEVPLAEGFYLVEQAPGYAELFRPGIEVEIWKTPEELLDKVRYYLDHDAERRAVAEAGRCRALSEHTWAHRFAVLFSELGIGP